MDSVQQGGRAWRKSLSLTHYPHHHHHHQTQARAPRNKSQSIRCAHMQDEELTQSTCSLTTEPGSEFQVCGRVPLKDMN